MRCKLCNIAHKNTARHTSWIQFQVCRRCYFFMDIFSWNTNYMQEYWETSYA